MGCGENSDAASHILMELPHLGPPLVGPLHHMPSDTHVMHRCILKIEGEAQIKVSVCTQYVICQGSPDGA